MSQGDLPAGSGAMRQSGIIAAGCIYSLDHNVERLAEVNALKVVVTTIANGIAVVTFIIHGAVAWRFCWYMMIACAIGGYTGARNARRISDRILRPFIIALGFSIAMYFFTHRSAL